VADLDVETLVATAFALELALAIATGAFFF
jgi:hypothetical protein